MSTRGNRFTIYRGILQVVAFAAGVLMSVNASAVTGFIENKGQWPSQVLFAADVPGGKLYIERTRLLYSFFEAPHESHNHPVQEGNGKDVSGYRSESLMAHAFEIKFLNANVIVHAEGTGALQTRYNYIYGSDPSQWKQSVKAYEVIVVSNLYDGIDLKLYANGSSIKYDLVVHPGGRIHDIQLHYNGLDSVQLKEKQLHLKTHLGEMIEMEPYVYQITDEGKKDIPCRYTLKNNIVRFDFPERPDPTATVVIDPLIIFSAYSGSTTDNWGNTATYDEAGNAYAGGIVYGAGYPTQVGSYQIFYAGGVWDIGIMKYDSAGTKLEYATYLGGNAAETPQSLYVNHAGELLILGTTSSRNFPVTNGSAFSGGTNFTPMDGVPYVNGSDLFVAKLSSDGSRLLGATYIGGSSNDGVNFISGSFDDPGMVQSPLCKNYGDQFRGDIITDANDNVYISSNTTSSNMPKALNGFSGGTHDAIVVKIASDLSAITWSRYLGGTGTDAAYSLKLDNNNTIFVAGGTTSSDFDGINGYKKTKGSDIDGWIAQLSNDGQQIINATYLGTSSYDQVYFVDINTNQEIYVLGQTQGSYPVSSGVFSQSRGGQFIHKLSHDLQSSIFSTVFGSGNNSPNISPTAFLVNDCNKIYVAGWGGALNTTVISYRSGPRIVTITRNFVGGDTYGLRVSSDAYQSTTSGNDFYLMVLDTDASSFLYGTFLGGNQSVTHVDGGTSRFDKRGIVYHAVCAGCGGYSDFPAVNSPAGHAKNAARTYAQCNNAIFKFDLATLRANIRTNSVALNDPGIDTVCYPNPIVFQNLSSGAKYYVWDMGDGTTYTKQDTSAITYTYQSQGIYHVTLTAYNAETCEGEDIASVVVSVFDVNIQVVDDGTICKGSQYQLSATGGVKYRWSDRKGNLISSVSSLQVSPEDTTTYHIVVESNVGCSIADSVTVNVIPASDYALSIDKHFDCWNRPTVRFNYTAKDSYTYTWNLGDGTSSAEQSFEHNYPADGIYTVDFHSANEYCSYDENIRLNIVTIKIPNVVTANNDERNDVLVVQAPDQVDIKIYNQWGRLVFQEENYQNDWAGAGLSEGVYYYRVTVPTEQTSCKGWVHLIK
ncbi:MAG TPA: gliding motility-associated C-terminal domain-containing protein [Ohtaekwangia sp.]|uniref:DUF7948 domain-containing protein n=1 Tax=Ohtaekwangia sp. TaxID=2066019 RepID=UPI002F94ACE9